MDRHEYAVPFRIDSASGQAAQSTYSLHVEQMIRQVLLTMPGERPDLPEFGCGLRQLIFAPYSNALDPTTQLIVQQALDRWLSGQITVKKVSVSTPPNGDESRILVQIEYVLNETQAGKKLEVLVF